MPMSDKGLNYVRSQICKAVTCVLGFQEDEWGVGETPMAALVFTPQEMGLGLGFPDPELAGVVQDVRRL